MITRDSIKKIRLALFLEIPEFANRIGVTKTTAYNYENGKRKPHMATIRKIKELAKELGWDITIESHFSDYKKEQS